MSQTDALPTLEAIEDNPTQLEAPKTSQPQRTKTVVASLLSLAIGFAIGYLAAREDNQMELLKAEALFAEARNAVQTSTSIFDTAMEVRDHTMGLEVRPTDMETAGHLFKSAAFTKIYQDPSATNEIDVIFEGGEFVSHGIGEFRGEKWVKLTPIARTKEWNRTGWARWSDIHVEY